LLCTYFTPSIKLSCLPRQFQEDTLQVRTIDGDFLRCQAMGDQEGYYLLARDALHFDIGSVRLDMLRFKMY